MGKDQRPHLVARARGVAEPVAKRAVEARPTCKLDKNELLGLVVQSSSADAMPRRSKRHTDLEISVEVIPAMAEPAPAPKPKTNRVVQTVRRANVVKSEMAPLRAAPMGTDVSMPAPAPAPREVAAVATNTVDAGAGAAVAVGAEVAPAPAPPRVETADPFADMFADTLGADPTPAPAPRAATGSGTLTPIEPAVQDIPTEIPAPDFDAFGDTAMANLEAAALLPPIDVSIEPLQPPPRAEGSIVTPPVAAPVHLHPRSSIDDTAPLQAIVDAAVAAEPAPVVVEPEPAPVVVEPALELAPVAVEPAPVVVEPAPPAEVVAKPVIPVFVLTPVRKPRSRWRSRSLVQQIAIGVALGCVGIGVYLGIAAF